MAKLPYTFTVCEPNEPPKSYTAMTPKLIKASMYGRDLTIDQRQYVYPCVSSDFEGRLREMLEKNRG